jgi:hypothetical protein
MGGLGGAGEGEGDGGDVVVGHGVSPSSMLI